MLIGALGCNFAWGIIDAILYLMGCLADQGRSIRILRAFQAADKTADAHLAIAAALPPRIAAVLSPQDFESLRRKLVALPPAPPRPRLGKDEWLAAFGVFLWVVVTTFPVAIPFIFMHDVERALRVSNGIALVMLFVTGYAFGRISDYRPWSTGLAMVALGVVLVAMTIALGG